MGSGEPHSIDLHNSITNGVAGQVGYRVEAQFSHKVGAVCFGRLYAEIKRYRNFFACASLREQLDYFSFARRQRISSGFQGDIVPRIPLFALQKYATARLSLVWQGRCLELANASPARASGRANKVSTPLSGWR